MYFLIFNCGTDSLRFIISDTQNNLLKGNFENMSTTSSSLSIKSIYGKQSEYQGMGVTSIEEATNIIFNEIVSKKYNVLNSINDIGIVGHRVVHGGLEFTNPKFLNQQDINKIKSLSNLDPLHNSKIAKLIQLCYELYNRDNYKNAGVFDTAFHRTLDKSKYLYPINLDDSNQYNIRKYGFHGISCQSVLRQIKDRLNVSANDLNLIICHLGGGCSITLVQKGVSVDTTMGISPLDGLMMSTRSGCVDPSIIPTLMREKHLTIEQAIEYLNFECGFKGFTGTGDIKTVCDMDDAGDVNAKLANKLFSEKFKQYLSWYIVQAQKLDAIVITGGMGVRNYRERKNLLSGLEKLGIEIDQERNLNGNKNFSKISKDGSLPVIIVKNNEEKEIEQQICEELL